VETNTKVFAETRLKPVSYDILFHLSISAVAIAHAVAIPIVMIIFTGVAVTTYPR